jgi:hypothetical protein
MFYFKIPWQDVEEKERVIFTKNKNRL